MHILSSRTSLGAALTAFGLLSLGASAQAQSVGINFTGSDAVGGSFPLGFSTVAGIVPQMDWNDADGDFGNIQPNSVFDSTGNTPGIEINYSGPSEGASQTDATLGGSYILTKGFLNINPPVPPAPGGSLPSVSATGISFASYDVYVYVDGATAGTATYLLGTDAQTVMTGTAFDGTFKEATSTAAGDYILFSGLTGSSFNLSGISTNAAPVDGLQIVDTSPVPEASTTVSFGLLLALGLGGFAAARKKAAAASDAAAS